MKNVQFLSELLMVVLENKMFGFDQSTIDEIYAKYDDTEELIELGEFNLEIFQEKVNKLKEVITLANKENNTILEFAAGSNNNFYTLWSYIYFNPVNDPQVFANAYESFMRKVSKVKEFQEAGDEIEENVIKYYSNSKGASTDLYQRKERLNALSNSI